jgi:DNA polymerase-3 subunit delta'
VTLDDAPWLTTHRDGLRKRLQAPPPALLVSGPQGVGKSLLVKDWVARLLCEAPPAPGEACGHCSACHWLAVGSHPDLLHVSLQSRTDREGKVIPAREISVDQAREAISFIQLSRARARRRVVLIEPADAMNTAASNALLKVLEEPPLNTLFILQTARPLQLLPTLRSRCERIDIGLPSRQQALAALPEAAASAHALAWAGGAPLGAIDLLRGETWAQRLAWIGLLAEPRRLDPMDVAERQHKSVAPGFWFAVIYKWLLDLLCSRHGGAIRFNPDAAATLATLAGQADEAALLALIRETAAQGRWVEHTLNRQLGMENWLIAYKGIFERA